MPRSLGYLLVFLLGCAVGVSAYLALPAFIHTGTAEPPVNHIEIDEQLATSGQPSGDQLDSLAAAGFQVVINLAPPTSVGSVADEGYRLGRTGITYVSIPVDFRAPDVRDFEQFAGLLNANKDRKVLAHCQINKRASVFTFLYRVTELGVDPDEAIEQVYAIWAPDENWQLFISRVLERAGIDFIL